MIEGCFNDAFNHNSLEMGQQIKFKFLLNSNIVKCMYVVNLLVCKPIFTLILKIKF